MINFGKFYKDKKIYVLIVQIELYSKNCIFFKLYYFKYEKKLKNRRFIRLKIENIKKMANFYSH